MTKRLERVLACVLSACCSCSNPWPGDADRDCVALLEATVTPAAVDAARAKRASPAHAPASYPGLYATKYGGRLLSAPNATPTPPTSPTPAPTSPFTHS